MDDDFYALLTKIVAVAVVSAIVVVCFGLIYLTIGLLISVS
jgi:hypothetical protein